MNNPVLEVFAEDFVFLEGPRWHDGRLWLSDMWGHTVWALSTDGSREAMAKVTNRPSGLHFLPDGRLVIVSMADRKLLVRGEDGALTEYADLSALAPADINDCVGDSAGNLYVGNFGYDLFSGEDAKLANLVRVAADQSASVVANDMNFPNGSVIADNGATLICAETFANRLTAFDIDASGSLSNRRVWAEMGDHTPDGICLDQEGAVWVSSFGAGQFLRVIEGGKIDQQIEAPGKRAVACNLGGEDGCTFFALTYEGEIEDIASGARY